MATPVAIGVDNGGTWIRFKGLDGQGRVMWSLKKPSPTVEHLPAFLHQQLKRFRGTPAYLAVGSRGVWKLAKRRAVKRELADLAKTIAVMSDVEAAWMAAFERHGILVISGTGSIAYGKNSVGECARAGGLGPEKGDEGSGYWIGKEWLRKTKTLPGHENKTVRQVAALARKVIARARRHDSVACAIVEEAQQELAGLVKVLAKRLRFTRVPLSWAGSVLENAHFRKGFRKALHPLRVSLQAARTDTATALARSIMTHAPR